MAISQTAQQGHDSVTDRRTEPNYMNAIAELEEPGPSRGFEGTTYSGRDVARLLDIARRDLARTIRAWATREHEAAWKEMADNSIPAEKYKHLTDMEIAALIRMLAMAL